MSELPTPPELSSDPDAAEILRVWVVHQELQCALYTGAFDDASTWGVLLADVVRNITAALHDKEGKDARATQNEIVTAFQHELAHEPQP